MASSQILFLSRSGDWWDAGLVLSAVIAGLAATAVGVFTAGSIMAHKREAKAAETSLETYKLGVEGRVADAKLAGIDAGKKAGEAAGVADKAKSDVAKAKVDVAKAQAEAALSNQKAAEADARAKEAALALAKFAAPRSLDATQRQRLQARLVAFTGTPFAVSIQTSGEAIDFERQLVDVLAASGWAQQAIPAAAFYTIPGQPRLGLVSLTGISIYVDQSRPDLFGATAAIKDALLREGFEVDAKRIIDGSEEVKDAIHIYVGEKPRLNRK